MDDFILIHEDREYLKKCLETIIERLNELGLTINEKKTDIQPIRHNVKFLGFSFRLTNTGKVEMKLLKGKISKQMRKLKKMPKDKIKESYTSWRSFAMKGDSYCLLHRADARVARLVRL